MPQYLRPFGPTIYIGKLNEDEIKLFQQIAKQTYDANKRIGKSLVGIMKDHFQAEVKDVKQFLGAVQPHILNFCKNEYTRRYDLVTQKEGKEPNWDKFSFDLGRGPWINFQKAGEFQPCHEHIGEISSVVYIDIPEEIAKEEYTPDTNMNCPGQIEFVFGSGDIGSSGTHKHVPVTGDFLVFPSLLKHIAYPFHTEDVTRISMSFNVVHYSTEEK